MTYIKISSGSSGYTGKVFSLQTVKNGSSPDSWYLQLNNSHHKMRLLNNQKIEPTYSISSFTAVDSSHYWSKRVDPNKKILVQYQYLPKVLDTRSTAWVDVSFCFATGPNSSSIADKNSSNNYVDATVHYKNVTRAGYDNYSYAAIGETIISHSQSSSRLIGIHYKSSSDHYNATSSSTTGITTDTGYTWFKFIELE